MLLCSNPAYTPSLQVLVFLAGELGFGVPRSNANSPVMLCKPHADAMATLFEPATAQHSQWQMLKLHLLRIFSTF